MYIATGMTGRILELAHAHPDRDAIVWCGERFSYGAILEQQGQWAKRLREAAVAPGTPVALEADFSPAAIAALLALIDRRCIVVPLSPAAHQQRDEYLRIAEVATLIDLRGSAPAVRHTGASIDHPMLRRLATIGHPGLVLFSSGSTGTSKAALHDFLPLLDKFIVRRPAVGGAGVRPPSAVDKGANLDARFAGRATNLDADQLAVGVVSAMPGAALGEGLEDEVHIGHAVMVAQGAVARCSAGQSQRALLMRSPASRPRAGMTWL